MKIKTARTSTEIRQISEICAAIPLFTHYGMTAAGARKIFSRGLRRKNSEILIAKDSLGQIHGFVWMVGNAAFDRSAYLRLIAVNPDLKRKGVGGRLMREAERRYLAPNGIFLLVTATNRTAMRFYKSLGYRRIGRLPGFIRTGMTEVVFYKSPHRHRL
jgi:ribosomal protein S18 acetylase RimI-like enzyme